MIRQVPAVIPHNTLSPLLECLYVCEDAVALHSFSSIHRALLFLPLHHHQHGLLLVIAMPAHHSVQNVDTQTA